MTQNLFETAARKKYRYPAKRGLDLATEDLFDLPLKHAVNNNLNDVAIALNEQIGAHAVSFVDDKPKDGDLVAKLDIVKFVIAAKKDAIVQAEAAADKRTRLQTLQEALVNRRAKDLEGKSTEEIQAEIDALLGRAPAPVEAPLGGLPANAVSPAG